MIPVFIEAALRSLLVGLAVAVGLRIFRVSNVLAQKAAWGLVLVSALAMPLLSPIVAQWHVLPATLNVILPAHPMTLLEELQARILAKGESASKLPSLTAPIPLSDSPSSEDSPAPEPAATPSAHETPSNTARPHHAAKSQQTDKPQAHAAFMPDRAAPSPAQSIRYSVSPTQKTQSPKPFHHIGVSFKIVALTLYCGIAAIFLARLVLGLFTTLRLWRTATPIPMHQLPCDAPSLQLRATSKVASPLTIGSGVLLPEDYTTWDSEKLRIVLAHERSHIRQGDFYLQVIASLYTALVWFSPLGWWLKHELADLAEAISDRAGIEEAASRTAYAQILLEFAAAPRQIPIGVAMARPGSLSRRIERLLNDNSFRQCFAGGRRALAAVALVPVALLASATLVRVQAAVDKQSLSSPTTVPTAQAAPASQAAPPVEAIQSDDQMLPQMPSTNLTVVAAFPELKTQTVEPVSAMIASVSPAPMIHIAPVAAVAASSMQDDGPLSFDRTLSVSGTAQLAVNTGSGDIHITRSSGNQVHIHGHIHVNDEGSEEQARQIAGNPPIEQSGDTIRVGQRQEHWHGISIDYQIEAPASTVLAANSGSGNIVDEGVGQNAKLQTGSGDIHATRLEGPFKVTTGSGDIFAEQTGQGDVVAETGSGDIELKNIHGAFRGQTGSGEIKASGTPSASWTLQTGSGNIELWTGNAPLTLEASTGSGSVSTEHEMMVQGSFDHHHIHGTLNGGGPTVRVQTGSGDIRIH